MKEENLEYLLLYLFKFLSRFKPSHKRLIMKDVLLINVDEMAQGGEIALYYQSLKFHLKELLKVRFNLSTVINQ